MIEMKLAVIGGGQMGRALVGGIISSGVVPAQQILLVDPSEEAQGWWAENEPAVEICDLQSAVKGAQLILLAVKPNLIAQVTQQQGLSWGGKLVVSIAAGVGLKPLCDWLGHQRAVRVMPNTPSLIREGASAFCCGQQVTAQDKILIQSMLDSVGMAVEVDESQMDAVTGLSGSGPAYVCLMIEALADGGVLAGLPRGLAMDLAVQTVKGTAAMIAQTDRHPGQLKDAVASPAGTTICALGVLEKNAVRGALIEAVAASAARSRQMGNND